MNNHKKKMVAPIVITILMILYYVVYFCFLFSLLDGILKYALGIIPLLFSALMIYVCVDMINEIKKGEKMILVNTDFISDKELETISLVK